MLRSPRRLLTRLALFAAAAAFLAVLPSLAADRIDPIHEELEANRRLLENWRRTEPEHYARLKRDWRTLMDLPNERRERLRQLDDDLHNEDAATQRLWIVLERYTAWLDRLPDEDRRRVERAPDTTRKLAVIRELREREWVAHLPKAVRDRVLDTPEGDDRAALVLELRAKERTRRAEWAKALRPPEPIVPVRLPVPIQRLRDFARFELTPAEKEQMQISGLDDPGSRARLVEVFALRHPEEIQKPRPIKDRRKKGETK